MPEKRPTYEELEQQLKQLTEEEKQLKEQLDFMEDILEKSVDVYWQYDLDGNPIYLSNAHGGLYGYSQEERYSVSLIKFFEGRERETHIKTWEELVSGRSIKQFEAVAVSKEKTPVPIEVKAWPLVKNDEVVGICGISRDISWRKKAEQELRDKEEKYRKIAENTSDVIWVWDLETQQYNFVSPALKNMTGYTVEEIPNRTLEIVVDEDKTKVSELFRRTSEDYGFGVGKGKYPDAERMEWREFHKDGHVFWAESIISIIRDENGKAAEILGVSRDITQRKKLEEELKNRNIFTETILNYLPIGIAAYKVSTGEITFVNDLFKSVYDLELSGLKNIRQFFERAYPDPEFRKIIESQVMADVASGDPSRMIWENVEITTKENKKKIITAQNIPLFDQDLMIATVIDVTVMKKLEEQLSHAQKMESIATLAGGIAHQFNNALSVITGYIGIMKLDSPGALFISNYVTPMEKSVNKMSRLTEQLLAYARGGKYQPKKISITEIVNSVLSIFESSIGPSVSLQTDFSCEDVDVEVDETQLQAAVSAVLVNAIEAIEKEGCITVACKKECIAEEGAKGFEFGASGNYACLIITDNGGGMDEEIRNRIFEPFFTTKIYGRGLGMAAVYGIMKNHDGWVDVRSEPGRGTTVSLYLPVV